MNEIQQLSCSSCQEIALKCDYRVTVWFCGENCKKHTSCLPKVREFLRNRPHSCWNLLPALHDSCHKIIILLNFSTAIFTMDKMKRSQNRGRGQGMVRPVRDAMITWGSKSESFMRFYDLNHDRLHHLLLHSLPSISSSRSSPPVGEIWSFHS